MTDDGRKRSVVGVTACLSSTSAKLPDLDSLFPTSYAASPFADLCREAFDALSRLMPDGDLPRVPGWNTKAYDSLVERYGTLPDDPAADLADLVRSISTDMTAGTTVWRTSELQYNVGAAVNVAAAAAYALALDLNIYLISDGQAGNAVLAEQAVGAILADLSGVSSGRAHGLFTFGGTGTIAYALKAGIRKAAPRSARTGAPSDIAIMITEDAHFSHQSVADWLGIGTDRAVVVPADVESRRSRVDIAEDRARRRIEEGYRISTMLINGGTTYDHAIDDIAAFAELRDRLVDDYSLDYRPHLHVDSVIGWAWLFFAGCDFENDDLGVPDATVRLLRRQYERIRQIRLADSWGVDFHKGVGGCPVDCSYVQFNDRSDLAYLRKGGIEGARLHQLAEEFSTLSPVDYTLETSRAGGKALAALTALHSVGRHGYQAILARLVDAVRVLREELRGQRDVTVLNDASLGFCAMVRLHPPGEDACDGMSEFESSSKTKIERGNIYLQEFFSWDNRTRMNVNGGGVVYSFTSCYRTAPNGAAVSAIKFYPTSPHVTSEKMHEVVALLMRRKAEFDRARIS